MNYAEVGAELASFGAQDTEPRVYFERLVCDALRGNAVEASSDPRKWDSLYGETAIRRPACTSE